MSTSSSKNRHLSHQLEVTKNLPSAAKTYRSLLKPTRKLRKNLDTWKQSKLNYHFVTLPNSLTNLATVVIFCCWQKIKFHPYFTMGCIFPIKHKPHLATYLKEFYSHFFKVKICSFTSVWLTFDNNF